MASSNRERRAAKQRRRDQKRGWTEAPASTPDRGLSAEALRRVLLDTGTDLAAGHDEALTELRHLLAEHLARRREYVLTACDEVLAGADGPAPGAGGARTTREHLDALLGALAEVVSTLEDHLARGGTVARWAEDTGMTSELAAVATVGVLARRALA